MLFLVAVLGYLTYQIMKPFLIPLAWAIVFSILFYPLNAYLYRIIRIRAVAASATLFLIVVVILGPLASIAIILNKEISSLLVGLNEEGIEKISGAIRNPNIVSYLDMLRSAVGEHNLPTPEEFAGYIRSWGAVMVKQLSARLSNVFSAVVDFLFMLFAAFFLLKDGATFLDKLTGYLPFRPLYNERLAAQVKDMVVSTVYGGIAVALIQGTLGGLAFLVLGIESPILWGSVMFVMSFVPLVGTFAVWGPAAAVLLFQGAYAKAVILVLIGIFVISMVDNILKPLIIGSRTKMHTLVIFFSVLGGLNFFGIIGLILGPLITALFVSMLEIFRHPDSEILQEEVPPLP